MTPLDPLAGEGQGMEFWLSPRKQRSPRILNFSVTMTPRTMPTKVPQCPRGRFEPLMARIGAPGGRQFQKNSVACCFCCCLLLEMNYSVGRTLIIIKSRLLLRVDY